MGHERLIKRISIAIHLTILLFAAIAILAGCSPQPQVYKRSEHHMGTRISISVIAESRRKAESAIEKTFAEFRRLEKLLTHYGNESEVGRLNNTKSLVNPSPELYDNVAKALSYSRLVEGAFDITVLPVLDLYETALQDEGREPLIEEIEAARKAVDYQRIIATRDRIEIGDNQRITLGGIAKGYAVDRGMDQLTDAGIASAIIEAGGDLRIAGKKAADLDWHIAIQNPRDSNDYVARIHAPDMAVVTSGDYERYYDTERLYHHIINPLTGRSATELISVTVIAPTAFDADVISTAAFVLGREDGLALVESLDQVEALLITRTQQVFRSSGWDAFESDE